MALSKIEVKNQLVDAIELCLAVQTAHLTGLKAGSLSKINQWLEERQTMVARLRQSLAEAQAAGLDAELRALLLEKISCILNTEKVIYAAAEQQRSSLAEKLNTMRRGKKALGRYGAALGNPPPRFVSGKR